MPFRLQMPDIADRALRYRFRNDVARLELAKSMPNDCCIDLDQIHEFRTHFFMGHNNFKRCARAALSIACENAPNSAPPRMKSPS